MSERLGEGPKGPFFMVHFAMMPPVLRRVFLLLLIAPVAILGCKKDEDDEPQPQPQNSIPTPEQVLVNLRFIPREAGAGFTFGDSYITDGTGRDALIERIRILFTDIRLTNASATAIRTFPGKVVLWDSNDPNALTPIGTVDAGSFAGVGLTIGLDDANNATVPADHTGPPLSDQTLYVGSVSGYRFYSIEGRIDANDDGIVSSAEPTFTYACITSAMRRNDQLYYNSSLAGSSSVVNIGLDVAGLLNGVNVMNDLNETGATSLNAQLMSNLQTAIEEP